MSRTDLPPASYGTSYAPPYGTYFITYPPEDIPNTVVNFGSTKLNRLTLTDVCRKEDGTYHIFLRIPLNSCNGSHANASISLNVYAPDEIATKIDRIVQFKLIPTLTT